MSSAFLTPVPSSASIRSSPASFASSSATPVRAAPRAAASERLSKRQFIGNTESVSAGFFGVRRAAEPAPVFASSSTETITSGLFGLGAGELAVIVGVGLLIFGPSKAPELGRSVGKALKSFKSASKEFETELNRADEEEEKPKAEEKKAEAPAKPEEKK
eukprot:tig00000615_g2602.t1